MKTMRNFRALLPALVLLAACSNPSGPSNAQSIPDLAQPTRRAPSDPGSMKASFSPVVKKAAPAVVNVASRRVVRQRVDPFWDLFMGGGAPREQVQGSLGSGAIVRADGVIITNHHNIEGIVEGNGDITVQLADRREFPATVLLDDPRADLAVLKIDTKGERLPVMAIDDQEQLEVGDLVLAMGNPFGVGQTVTNGIVSALARTDVGAADFGSYIQTDAAINFGNSGGPLINARGEVIGINAAISARGSSIGFAVPINLATSILPQLRARGRGKAERRRRRGRRRGQITHEEHVRVLLAHGAPGWVRVGGREEEQLRGKAHGGAVALQPARPGNRRGGVQCLAQEALEKEPVLGVAAQNLQHMRRRQPILQLTHFIFILFLFLFSFYFHFISFLFYFYFILI